MSINVSPFWTALSIASTNPLVEPPFKNPSDIPLTEIEVTDPMHPLFGRKFTVLYIGKPRANRGHVSVIYRDEMRLRLPLSVTQVIPPQPRLNTKLTLESVSELITLIESWEAPCLSHPIKSGTNSVHLSNTPSEPTSSPSSKR